MVSLYPWIKSPPFFMPSGHFTRCMGLRLMIFKNFPQFVVICTVKGFVIINKAEVDVFLEFSCFFYDPTDVGNLVSGSSAFSKSTLNTWKLMVHVQMKPGLENTEHLLRPQDLKRSVFIPISKKSNAKESSNYHTIAPISHAGT